MSFWLSTEPWLSARASPGRHLKAPFEPWLRAVKLSGTMLGTARHNIIPRPKAMDKLTLTSAWCEEQAEILLRHTLNPKEKNDGE